MGIPTANIPIEGLSVGGHTDVKSGVYYGWAGLSLATSTSDFDKAANPIGHEDGQKDEMAVAASEATNTGTEDQGTDVQVYPMVMSIGWNPYYQNEVRTVEVHIMHKFEQDFYNAWLNLTILGFIRQEKDYKSLDALIEDINIDIDVARQSLERGAYMECAEDPYLKKFDWAESS